MEVLLLEEQLEEQLVEPAVDVPVDVPQVVADGVVAVVGELDRRPPPLALALALHPADEDLPAHQLELFELVEELGVEQGAVGSSPGCRGAAGWIAVTSDDCDGHGGSSIEAECGKGPRRVIRSDRRPEQPQHQAGGDPEADQPGDQRREEDRPAGRRPSGRRRCRKPSAVNQLSRITSAPPSAVRNGQRRLDRQATAEAANSSVQSMTRQTRSPAVQMRGSASAGPHGDGGGGRIVDVVHGGCSSASGNPVVSTRRHQPALARVASPRPSRGRRRGP